jgi:hypothetical protein
MRRETAMKIDPALGAMLERRGESLKGLLETEAGPGEGSIVRGVTAPDGKPVTRIYVEGFLLRRAEARSVQEARDRRWTRGIAIAALLTSLLAVIVSAGA